jgi:nucleoside phosphorylase/CheY-like chemotaxis protein
MIRVLVVEDDPKKLQRIMSALSSVEDFNMAAVTHVIDVISAKKLIQETAYDLLILDITLPYRIDEEPKSHAGIDLLDEIMERSVYKLPQHIIGITAHHEVVIEVTVRFSSRSLTLVFYDETSDAWLPPLKARVRHTLLSKKAQELQQIEFGSHLAVVCALESTELGSLLKIGWDWKTYYVFNDDTIYYEGRIGHSGNEKLVYAAAASRVGMSATSVLAMKMISAFRPKYLAMSGITAGVRGKTRFGDIVIPDPCWDYGSGKWEMKDGELAFSQDPHQLPLNGAIRNKLRHMSNDRLVLFNIRNAWQGEAPEHDLNMHVGPLASGASVLADGSIINQVKLQSRGLLGIEMETYGLYVAADEATSPRPTVFAMKSVVDFADGKKNDSFHKYAAFTSAQGLKYFVETYLMD